MGGVGSALGVGLAPGDVTGSGAAVGSGCVVGMAIGDCGPTVCAQAGAEVDKSSPSNTKRNAPSRTKHGQLFSRFGGPDAKLFTQLSSSRPGVGRHHWFNYEARPIMTRCVVIVLDSVGIGALPDADVYGDTLEVNTLANTAARVGGLHMPNFERLGLGWLTGIRGVAKVHAPSAYVARVAETSKGKDTITGHWEMAGIHTEVPFPTYPLGFPPEVIAAFRAICGTSPLGNVPASGTEIIEALGPKHLETGRPILYTSADSVFQVAAHEEVVPLAMLYEWCERARAVLVPPHDVNRVIARPFVGSPGAFVRTPNRRDFALDPPFNVLDRLAQLGIGVYAVGKISDIFNGRGVSVSVRVADNEEAMLRTFELLESVENGLIFVNLNDFDTKFGHRRDARGYAGALERLDRHVPGLEKRLRAGDLAIVTADHGCDPTAPGTDHTREYVPYLEVGARRGEGGTRRGLELVSEAVRRTLSPAGPALLERGA